MTDDDELPTACAGWLACALPVTVGAAAHQHSGGRFSAHKCWIECNSLEVAPDRESDEAVTARREIEPTEE